MKKNAYKLYDGMFNKGTVVSDAISYNSEVIGKPTFNPTLPNGLSVGSNNILTGNPNTLISKGTYVKNAQTSRGTFSTKYYLGVKGILKNNMM